jgi:hypothetical protein
LDNVLGVGDFDVDIAVYLDNEMSGKVCCLVLFDREGWLVSEMREREDQWGLYILLFSWEDE